MGRKYQTVNISLFPHVRDLMEARAAELGLNPSEYCRAVFTVSRMKNIAPTVDKLIAESLKHPVPENGHGSVMPTLNVPMLDDDIKTSLAARAKKHGVGVSGYCRMLLVMSLDERMRATIADAVQVSLGALVPSADIALVGGSRKGK